MKSAYELAMERLEKSAPSVKLSEPQRAEIAELESLYKAKIAEKEVFLGGEIAKARAAGEREELDALQLQLAREMRRLQNECEERKERVRAGS